ncbi:anti-sigma factor antagonist [Rhodobacteraceae bacterium CCMM004]|nr:anti-sigma factor antagonist [Rhodobacteraceae bacterium CCMM004]
MELETRATSEVLIVSVGEARLDAAAAVRFKDALREAAEGGPPRVILDLSGVEFLDSSGLGAVVGAMKQLQPEQRLELAGLRGTVAKVFRLTRMDRVFRIHHTADDALAAEDAAVPQAHAH